jgi:GPI-anchor transamidase subunit K
MLGADINPTPWAVVVSSSRYFHNYRHTSSALSVYETLRQRGVPDSQIVLMLAGNPCDERNAARGRVFNSLAREQNLYPPDVRVDYRGTEVTVEAFLGVLTDQVPAGTPALRRLQSGPRDRVLIYLTGHGGDGFLKFGDQYELTADELAESITLLFARRGCAELLLLVDTCQAATLGARLVEYVDSLPYNFSVRTIVLASSDAHEKSYSHDLDRRLGVAISDRFTYHLHRFLREAAHTATLGELEAHLRLSRLRSTVVRHQVGWEGDVGTVPMASFFGAAADRTMPPPPPAPSRVAREHEAPSRAAREHEEAHGRRRLMEPAERLSDRRMTTRAWRDAMGRHLRGEAPEIPQHLFTHTPQPSWTGRGDTLHLGRVGNLHAACAALVANASADCTALVSAIGETAALFDEAAMEYAARQGRLSSLRLSSGPATGPMSVVLVLVVLMATMLLWSMHRATRSFCTGSSGPRRVARRPHLHSRAEAAATTTS